MADTDTQDEVVIESKADAETQTKAAKMGWIGPDKYKGPPEKFIDADEYVERGESMLPILKANNGKLQQQVNMSQAEIRRLNDEFARAKKQLEDIEERHSVDVQKAREDERKRIKADLVAANKEGDHELVAELTDELTQLNADAKADSKKEDKKADDPPAKIQLTPAMQIFIGEDAPWFGKDEAKTDEFIQIATRLRKEGNTQPEYKFYQTVLAELEDGPAPAKSSKVAQGRNGSGEGGQGSRSSSGGKGYNSLPADAKAACDADAKKFVGPNKRYKDVGEWRSQYAKLYFSEGGSQ